MALKLTDIEKKLNFEIQRGSAMHYLYKIAENAYDIVIDFDVYLLSKGKNLQRPLCWNLFQKQQLIISVLKGIQLPPIQIIIYADDVTATKTRKTIYKIIDGKQRLSTLISFYKNEFPIEWNGENYFFNDLDSDCQHEILYFDPLIDVAYEYDYDMISDDNKIAWFEMINFTGTPQDIEHLNNLKK
jgi:hypothetical protein